MSYVPCHCGGRKSREAKECMSCRSETLRRKNEVVRSLYQNTDLSYARIGEVAELTAKGVADVVAKLGIYDPSRAGKVQERRWREGKYDASDRSVVGRKPVWPDCPPDLHGEYMRLRNSCRLPAAEARRELERRAL